MELRGEKGSLSLDWKNRDNKTSQHTNLGRSGFLPSSPSARPHPKTDINHPKHAVGTGNGGKRRENNRENTQAGIEFEFESEFEFEEHLGRDNSAKDGKSGKSGEPSMEEILGVLKEKQLSLRPGKARPVRSKEILGITEQGEIMEGVIKARARPLIG